MIIRSRKPARYQAPAQAVRAEPSGRVSSAMAYLGGDQVLLFGGELPSGSNSKPWVYELNNNNTWASQTLATVP